MSTPNEMHHADELGLELENEVALAPLILTYLLTLVLTLT